MEIIAVGTGAIDVVQEVATYPIEDSKARSLASYKCRGGNAASALVVCSQLGGRCRWLSTSTDPHTDSEAAFVHGDLAGFGVDCSLAVIEKEGSMPVSYILSSRATGSRTIVHSRTIAELSYEAFAEQVGKYLKEIRGDAKAPVWFHFEGRNMETVRQMMLHVRESAPHAKISVELEFPRYPWSLAKTLASLADYVFMSKDYIRDNVGVLSASAFFNGIREQQWDEKWNERVKAFICPWGSDGVYYLEMAGPTEHHIPAARLERVVESNGAGDTFIGATLAGLSCGQVPLRIVLKAACDVATVKCSQRGFKLPAEQLAKWRNCLRDPQARDEVDAHKNHEHNAETSLAVTSLAEPSTHCVTSEVELELERLEQTAEADADTTELFLVELLPTFMEDDDGDIIVPRRQLKKRRNPTAEENIVEEAASRTSRLGCHQREEAKGEPKFILEARSRSTWDTAGTQLWRAAFVLAEYIYSTPDLFAGQTVLELGCGIGFLSIVASQFSRCIYATDSDEDALQLAQRNSERNCPGRLQLRLLNWGDSNMMPTSGSISSTPFDWTTRDQTELQALTIVIASDVFYDDGTTLLFLSALKRLMLQYSRARAFVSLERRSVFSATAMRVVSLGYETFRDHVCPHEPRACHTYVSKNQVRCRRCNAAKSDGQELLQFVAYEIDASAIPKRFKYERLATLMLWRIDAVVVP